MAASAVIGRGEKRFRALEQPVDRPWIEVRAVREHDHGPSRVLAERREPAAQRGAGPGVPVLTVHERYTRRNLKLVGAFDDDDLVHRGV